MFSQYWLIAADVLLQLAPGCAPLGFRAACATAGPLTSVITMAAVTTSDR
jgi:hypothetical protein